MNPCLFFCSSLESGIKLKAQVQATANWATEEGADCDPPHPYALARKYSETAKKSAGLFYNMVWFL